MLDYLHKQPANEIDNKKFVAFGQSIGGAVAIDLVSRNQDKFKALILENTFTSLPKLIPIVMPIAKYFTFLCTERWMSEDRISVIDRIPILFLSGTRDELIPPSMMKELFEAAPTKKKKFAAVTGGTHNDTCIIPVFWTELITFWRNFIDIK